MTVTLTAENLIRVTSIAQKCLEAEDPYAEAIKHQGYKGMPDPFTKRFHFEDNSYLEFRVSYTPVCAGRTMQEKES